MKISEICEQSNKILCGIQGNILDTRLLLAHFLGKDKLFVMTNPDFEVDNVDGFFALLDRRAKGEPIAYIIGKVEFMSLEFKVNRHTLIPRPDTETLVELAIEQIGDGNAKFLDIGTGSGCIAVSVAKYCSNARGVAVDISSEALAMAKHNAGLHNVDIEFIEMDILTDFPKGEFDIIVSNPPYIEEGVIPQLENNVKDYEPFGALCGGTDGLDFYKRISGEARYALKAGGMLAFEVGHTQHEAVAQIMKNDGYSDIAAVCDLSGIRRVVYGSVAVTRR